MVGWSFLEVERRLTKFLFLFVCFHSRLLLPFPIGYFLEWFLCPYSVLLLETSEICPICIEVFVTKEKRETISYFLMMKMKCR